MADKDVVKELFENTALYLTYDYNLQIRKETVETFTEGKNISSVLDIPCGTGAISIPLLPRIEKLTLIDISSNMLSIAEKAVPAQFKNKAELINKNFFDCDLPEQSYDLVLCLGLLAHIDSPEKLMNKLCSLVKPGGMLIIQNTNSKHFYSYLIRAYLGLKNIISKQPYALNKVPAKLVEEIIISNGFELQDCFRYNQSFLGLSNLFSNEKKYKLTRSFFGKARKNKNASLGSDHTYLFKKIG